MPWCHFTYVKPILTVKYMLIKQIIDLPFVGHFGFRSLIFSSYKVDGGLVDYGVGVSMYICSTYQVFSLFLRPLFTWLIVASL